MSKYLCCGQCFHMTNKLYTDPRSNPVDTGDCLCLSCYEYAIIEKKEEKNDGKKMDG